MIEIAPGFRRDLTETFGTSQGRDIMSYLESRNMTFMEGFEALVNTMSENVRAPIDTLANMEENLRDAWKDFQRALGELFTPLLKSVIPHLTEEIEGLTATIKTIKDWNPFRNRSDDTFTEKAEARSNYNKFVAWVINTIGFGMSPRITGKIRRGERLKVNPLPGIVPSGPISGHMEDRNFPRNRAISIAEYLDELQKENRSYPKGS